MSRRNSPGPRFNQARRPYAWRPKLEALEGRCLPSTVTNLMDGGPGSLRDAIAVTPPGGTVDFQPGLSGTITLTSGELAIAKDLTITGPGAGVITVSGNYTSRVFDIVADVTVDISGLTVADAARDGIENLGRLTITDSTVSGNTEGGVANYGTLTLINSAVSGNHSGGVGNRGTLTMMQSTVDGNLTGGVWNGTGSVTILDSTISRNGGQYGGVYSGGGTLTIMNSTISRNFVGRLGGGIDQAGGTMTVLNCTISNNGGSSAIYGGGIAIAPAATGSLLRDTIVAGNSAYESPDVSGGIMSEGHNLIGDGSGGYGFTDTDQVGTHDHPIDPRLGPLADNGGPTFTMALLPGSPAIDAGDNTGAPLWDQRGAPFRRVVNGVIDIGAFEVQAGGHGHPTGQPLPDPVPVQGIPEGPLAGQPPDLPADLSLLPEPGLLDGARGAWNRYAHTSWPGARNSIRHFGSCEGPGGSGILCILLAGIGIA